VRGAGYALVAGVALALAAVGLAGASGSGLRSGGPLSAHTVPEALVCALGGVALAAWYRGRNLELEQRREAPPEVRRLRTGVFALLCVAAAALPIGLIAVGRTPGKGEGAVPSGENPSPAGQPSAPAQSRPPAPPVQGGRHTLDLHLSLTTVLLVLAVPAAVAVLVLLVRWARERRRAPLRAAVHPEPPGDEQQALSAAVDAGRAALRGSDARAAIIACYAAMEDALAGHGVARRSADSPSDLLRRAAERGLLDPAGAPRTLTALFREARFSTHPMTERQREEARAALDSVADALEREAPTPVTAPAENSGAEARA